MKIIGEKINGTRKTVAKAIAERDGEFIRKLALRQVKDGVDWLDINAGTAPDRESNDLVWLIQQVQQVADLPLCLDSANPEALKVALTEVRKKPMINSISGEKQRLDEILPIVAEYGCEVIALCMDDHGIPGSVEGRMEVIAKVFYSSRQAGIQDDKIFVDPLVMTIATNTNAARVTLDTIRAIRATYPQAHISCGLSNISFGLPVRSLINRTFFVLAMEAGMDTAIIDPNDRELRAAIVTANMLLGNDRYCLAYTKSYRAGVLENQES